MVRLVQRAEVEQWAATTRKDRPVPAAPYTPRNQHTGPRNPRVKIPDPKPMTGDWVAIPEIADLNYPEPVKYTTVEQWRSRRRSADIPFPAPDDHIGSFPVWRLPRIKAWFKATGKPYTEDLWRAKKASGGYRRHKAKS